MQIIEKSHKITHVMQFRVEGAPIVKANGYVNEGKEMMAGSLSSNFRHGDGPNIVTVHGKVLKKDGVPGKNVAEATFYLRQPTWNTKTKAPDWIAELFATR